MIANAGACIVLAGNKLVDGAVVLAGGVRQEVEIARSQNKAIIPVGATGHVARELWEQCTAKPSDFLGDVNVAAQVAVLGDPTATVDALAKAIIEILKQLDR
jgi:hypothetical protein